MIYWILSRTIFLLHAIFIVFAVLGGLLLFVWPQVVWIQLACLIYVISIVVGGWRCPLTDWEIALRRGRGEVVEWSEFINHYGFRPLGLTGKEKWMPPAQIAVVIVVNSYPYFWFFMQK